MFTFAGGFIAGLILMVVLAIIAKIIIGRSGPSGWAKEHAAETIELFEERNRIDDKIRQALDTIAAAAAVKISPDYANALSVWNQYIAESTKPGFFDWVHTKIREKAKEAQRSTEELDVMACTTSECPAHNKDVSDGTDCGKHPEDTIKTCPNYNHQNSTEARIESPRSSVSNG